MDDTPMNTALLSTTYFGPVQWYQKLYRYDQVLIEQHETFQKQTFRNRCLIATTQGIQVLTVPVSTGDSHAIKDVRVSDADDLWPFFEKRWDFLLDFNEAIRQKMCELLDIHPQVGYTSDYQHIDSQHSTLNDFRTAIDPKHPVADADFIPRRYYQVFEQKHGFLPNLSILDLLFNMGPESIYYLQS